MSRAARRAARISGGTLIEPSGEVSFVNAEFLRRGSSA